MNKKDNAKIFATKDVGAIRKELEGLKLTITNDSLDSITNRLDELESSVRDIEKWMQRLEQDVDFNRSSYID